MGKVFLFVCLWIASASLCAQSDSLEFRLNRRAERVLLSQPDSAFRYANQALFAAREKGNRPEEGTSNQLIGLVFSYQGVYLQALDHFLKAETIFRETGDIRKLAANLNQQGLIYYNMRQPEKALSSHEQALKYYETLDEKSGIAYSLGCIGRLYEKSGDYEKSSAYQFRALDIYRSIQDHQGEATILENLGSILEDEEDYPGALDYFRKSLALNRLTGDSLEMIINLNNVGDNYRKTGDYANAIIFTQQALDLARRRNNRYQISSAFKDLSKSYHLAGDNAKAYESLEIGRNLYEDIFAQDAVKQMALLQTIFETERKNHAIQQLKDEQRLDFAIRIFLISGLALLAILAFVIISRQRMKIIRDRAKNDQERQVYETKTRLMNAELENIHLREKTLKQELETHSNSLTMRTLHIMEKNKMLEDIQTRLSDLLALEREEQRRKIRETVKMIDHNFQHDRDWEDFNRTFGQVHKDFFEKLSARSRDLTPSDLRLAALIRLKLPSLDISTLLGISAESLRVARYRLKKKLTLDEGESLATFIHGIA